MMPRGLRQALAVLYGVIGAFLCVVAVLATNTGEWPMAFLATFVAFGSYGAACLSGGDVFGRSVRNAAWWAVCVSLCAALGHVLSFGNYGYSALAIGFVVGAWGAAGSMDGGRR